MIDERQLESLLAQAADPFVPPAHGPDQIRRRAVGAGRKTRSHVLEWAAAAIVVVFLAIAGVALVDQNDSSKFSSVGAHIGGGGSPTTVTPVGPTAGDGSGSDVARTAGIVVVIGAAGVAVAIPIRRARRRRVP